jgi:hypothetical protein
MRSMSRSRVPDRRRLLAAGRLLFALLLVFPFANANIGYASSISVASANLTVFATCTLSGTTGASASVRDSFVDENAPTTTNGGAATMNSQSRNNRNRRSYVSFDLTTCAPNVPSSAIVTSATLRLWVTAVPVATCRTEDVFAVTSAWTQSAITWNNQPFGTAINSPASGTRTDSITVGSGAGCTIGSAAQYVPWNVTTNVANFVSGGATNFGWMIRDDAEGANGSGFTVTFSTSDAASVPQAPQLVVTYRR